MSLPDIILSASTVAAGSAEGAVVGAFSGIDPSAELVMPDTGGDRFKLYGNNLVVGPVPIVFGEATPKVVVYQENNIDRSKTFEFSIEVTGTPAVEPVILDRIDITNNQLLENSPAGTYIGSITGTRSGSALTLVDDLSGRFALTGLGLKAGPVTVSYASVQRANVVVRESNSAAASPGYRDQTIPIEILRDGSIALPDITAVPINITLPVITGTAQVGQTLSVSTGAWTNHPTNFTYRWQADHANIAGANNSSYTLTSAELGKQVTVIVSAINDQGFWYVETAATIAVTAPLSAPTNTVLPVITGTAQVGQTLSVNTGTWAGSPSSFAYQWLRNGTPINGSVNPTRVLSAADLGATLSCVITATNDGGSTAATSLATAAVIDATAPLPVNTVAPAVSGSTAVGSVLTSTPGTWSNNPTSFSYQWRRNGVNIAGATASTYTLTTDDAGQSIVCRVTATNTGGSAAMSSNTIAVDVVLSDISIDVSNLLMGVASSGSFAQVAEGGLLSLADAGGLNGFSISQDNTWSWDGGQAGQATGDYSLIVGETLSGHTHFTIIGITLGLSLPSFTSAPIISGSVAGILTLTPPTVSNSVSVAYQWYRDLVPVPGATGTTFDSADWPGKVNVVATATSPTGAIASIMSDNFINGTSAVFVGSENFDYSVANNTKYDTIAQRKLTLIGANAFEQDKYVIRSNAAAKTLGNSAGQLPVQINNKDSRVVAVFDQDIGENQRVEIDIVKGALANQPLRAVIWWKDEFNFIYAAYASAGIGWQINTVTDGTVVDQTALKWGAGCGFISQGASYTSTFSARFDIVGGILSVSERVDGAADYTPVGIYRQGIAGTLKAMTLDLSAIVSSQRGHRVGVMISGSSSSVDVCRFYQLTAPVTVVSVTPTSASNSPIFTANVQYVGATDPTGFDIAVMLPNGTPLLARTAATVASMGSGAATISITSPALRAAEGGNAIVQIWKTGPGLSGDEGASQQFAVPVYQTVFPYRQGINEGYTQQNGVDPFVDLWQSADVRVGHGGSYTSIQPDTTYNPHGLPTNLDPAGGFTAIIKDPTFSPASRAGTYTITFPPTLTIGGNAKAALTNIDPVAGTATYTRPTTNPGGTQTLVWFTGSVGPTDRITIRPSAGDVPSKLYTDSHVSILGALGGVIRFMTPHMTNGPLRYKATTPYQVTQWSAADRFVGGPASLVPESIEQAVSACNQVGADLWWPVRAWDDESLIRAEAAIAATTLDGARKAGVEWANEVWNPAFPQYNDAALAGCRMGLFVDTVTSAATATPLPITYNGATSNTSSLAVAANEYLFAKINGVGSIVLRAKAAVAANTLFPITITDNGDGTTTTTLISAGDSNWAIIAGNEQVTNARHRFQAHMTDRTVTIWKEEFAAVGRPAPSGILSNMANSAITSYVSIMLNWVCTDGVALYDKLGFIAAAPYWGGELLDYASDDLPAGSPYPHPWTSVEKNLVATDQQAFFTALAGVLRDTIDKVVGRALSYKTDIARFLVSKGRSPDLIQLCSYEYNHNLIAYKWPAGLKDNMNAAYGAFQRSPEMGALSAYSAQQMATKVGGTHVIFDALGGMPTDRSDGTSLSSAMHNWGVTEGEMDTVTSGAGQNYRFTAFANAKNGVFS